MTTDAQTLLDDAAEKCGGYAELARRTGINAVDLSKMKSGKRPISPENIALIADVLELPGEEVQKLVAWTIIEAAKNASKREKLKRAFFGCWVAGVVGASLQISPTPSNAASTDFLTNYEVRNGFTGYTLSRIWAA